MTTIYDPHDDDYLDEAAVRGELTRVFTMCRDCGACVDRCDVFPTLFDLLEDLPGRDPGLLTPAEQDSVTDRCFHCGRCEADCPYSPARHAAAVDVPRSVLRAGAMRVATGQRPFLHSLLAGATARSDALRRLAGSAPAGGVPHAPWRKALAAITRRTPLPIGAPSAKERFSTWFARHVPRRGRDRQGKVGIVPTCLVEYQVVDVGRDVVRVFEHSGIECWRSAVGCCGSPWLHAGDVKRFAAMVDDNVVALAREIAAGELDAIVVIEPTCRSVMQREYPRYAKAAHRTEAELVVDHLRGPAEHLLATWSAVGGPDVDLTAAADRRVTYHAACHGRGSPDGSSGLDLLQALGLDVTEVDVCAGIGGRWDRESLAATSADQFADRAAAAMASNRDGADLVGECSLANRTIAERAGADVVAPISLVARILELADDVSDGPGSVG